MHDLLPRFGEARSKVEVLAFYAAAQKTGHEYGVAVARAAAWSA